MRGEERTMLRQVALAVKDMSPFRDLAMTYGCKVAVADCQDFDARSMVLLLEIDGKDQGGFMRDLQRAAGVRHAYWARNGAKGTLAMAVIDRPVLCEVARSSGALCKSCPFNSSPSSEMCEWKLLVRSSGVLSRCLDMLEAKGLHAEVREVTSASRECLLTPRQKEVLEEAVKHGYFEFPRKTSLTQLAERLSIRSSTLDEILRRAESKVVRYSIEP